MGLRLARKYHLEQNMEQKNESERARWVDTK
jgi:hypothetical protein